MAGKDHQCLQAVTHGIAAGHQLRPRRRANRHAVERLRSHAVACELVDIRSFDVAAVIAEVRVTEIVGHDDHDVGLRCLPVCQSIQTCEAARQKGKPYAFTYHWRSNPLPLGEDWHVQTPQQLRWINISQGTARVTSADGPSRHLAGRNEMSAVGAKQTSRDVAVWTLTKTYGQSLNSEGVASA